MGVNHGAFRSSQTVGCCIVNRARRYKMPETNLGWRNITIALKMAPRPGVLSVIWFRQLTFSRRGTSFRYNLPPRGTLITYFNLVRPDPERLLADLAKGAPEVE